MSLGLDLLTADGEPKTTGLRRLERGRFERRSSGSPRRIDDPEPLPVTLGSVFGLTYDLEGTPVLTEPVPTEMVMRHPRLDAGDGAGKTRTSYESSSYVGMPNVFLWLFEEEGELRAGEWSIELSVGKGEARHELRETFHLVLAEVADQP